MAFTLQPLAETEGVHSASLPVSRNRVGPPGWGGDSGRLSSLHPQQAPALRVSARGRAGQGSHPLLCQHSFQSGTVRVLQANNGLRIM